LPKRNRYSVVRLREINFWFSSADAAPNVQLDLEGLSSTDDEARARALRRWESPAGSPLLALIRSVVGSESAASLMREFVSREILASLAEALELDQPQWRASLAASQLIGLAMLRYVVKVEPLASASPRKVAAWIGPTLQRYFTDPAATRSSG